MGDTGGQARRVGTHHEDVGVPAACWGLGIHLVLGIGRGRGGHDTTELTVPLTVLPSMGLHPPMDEAIVVVW